MAIGWRTPYIRYKDYFLNIALFYKKRQDIRIFLELLLTLATISIFAVAAIKPTLTTISGLITEIEEKEVVLDKMERKIQSLTKAQNYLRQNRSLVDLLNESLPDNASLVPFVKQVEGLSQQNSLLVRSLTSNEATILGKSTAQNQSQQDSENNLVKVPDGAESLLFGVSASQDYAPLINFLDQIENLKRPYIVNNITMNTLTDSDQLVLFLEGDVLYINSY